MSRLLALVICCSISASAQDSTTRRDSTLPRRDGWIVGPSIGMPTANGETSPELLTVGLNFTRLSPGRPGADIAFGTMPRALADGVAVFGFRADVAYPLAVFPHLMVFPAAGLSVIGALGEGGGGGTMGVNAGLSAVFHGDSPTGLRLGVTAHQFSLVETTIFLIEVGMVHVPAPGP
jgi:hypothetical protein